MSKCIADVRHLSVLFMVLWLVAATNAWAQPAAGFWCGTYPYDPEHPLSWERLQEQVKDKIDNAHYKDAYLYITDRYKSWIADAPTENKDIRAVNETLDVYLQRISEPGKEVPQIWRRNHPPESGMILYELGPLTDNDEARVVAIPCAAFDNPDPKSYQITIGYLAYSMKRTGEYRDLKFSRWAAAAVSSVTYKSYENLLYNGLAMWPLELWLNGKRVPDDFTKTAPRTQLVALRPNASPALKFDGNEDSEVDFALTLEPIGFVKYRSADFKKWWGASALVSVTNDNGVGYGALARWNNYTLGVARHDKDSDTLLYVSVDLYKYILGEDGRTNKAEAFLSKLKEKVSEDLKNKVAGGNP